MAQVSAVREQVAEDSLSAYLDAIGQWPLLTAEEEVDLARAMEAGRDAAAELFRDNSVSRRAELKALVLQGGRARTRFLESNTRLVVSIAKRFRGAGAGIELIDLIQEGNLGLMRAVDKFDWRRGFKFSTYATWWIRQAITRALQEKGRTVRLPPRLHDATLKVRAASAEVLAETGKMPSLEEVAERSGLDTRRAEEAIAVKEFASLESPVGDTGAVLGDFIVTDDEPSPEDLALDKEVAGRLRRALQRLDDREQLILRDRFGLDDGEPQTRVEIGRTLGLTSERIAQLERHALSKIRHPAFGLLEKDFI